MLRDPLQELLPRLRTFMFNQTRDSDLAMFVRMALNALDGMLAVLAIRVLAPVRVPIVLDRLRHASRSAPKPPDSHAS